MLARKEQRWFPLLEVPDLDRRIQRAVAVVVLVGEGPARPDPVPRAAVEIAAARRWRVLVDAHAVPEASQDLLARPAIDIRRLDRRVVPGVGRGLRIAQLGRERRAKVRKYLLYAVGVGLWTPLPDRRVEPEDLEALVVARDQLILAVPVDVGQLDRRVLRRIRPPAPVAPRRQHERRSARVRVGRIRLRTLLRPGHRRHRHDRSCRQHDGRDLTPPEAVHATRHDRTVSPSPPNDVSRRKPHARPLPPSTSPSGGGSACHPRGDVRSLRLLTHNSVPRPTPE